MGSTEINMYMFFIKRQSTESDKIFKFDGHFLDLRKTFKIEHFDLIFRAYQQHTRKFQELKVHALVPQKQPFLESELREVPNVQKPCILKHDHIRLTSFCSISRETILSKLKYIRPY